MSAVILSERERPRIAVAFGSPLDLVRLRKGPVRAEVCEACQTINTSHARFCKGCDGKLPGYFASADSDDSPLLASEGDVEARSSRYAIYALIGLWSTVAVVALFLAHGPRSAGTPTRALEHAALPAPIERAVARVDPPAAAAEPAGIAQDVAMVAATPGDAGPASGVALSAVEPAAGSPRPTEPAPPSRVSRVSSQPPPPARPGIARSGGVAGPMAQCGGLNFFSRAVCMNNQCARPDMRRSAQCAETVRQQRLGEARRNPKLLG